MVAIALDIKPDYVIVPEKREEGTTEGGLDITSQSQRLAEIVDNLQSASIPVSLFIDAEIAQIKASVDVKAQYIELHTGQYAKADSEASREQELAALASCCEYATRSGLRVNAGHSLTYWNIYPVACLLGREELNIGHTIVSCAALLELERAVREMKQAMRGL